MRRTTVFGLSVAGVVLSMVAVTAIADAFAGQTTRVSVNDAGEPANGNGLRAGGLSANGLYVVFGATSTNLGASGQQVYRRECANRACLTGRTEVVSMTPGGAPSSGFSPSVSATGRFVAFVSSSTDLVAGADDTNGAADVFLRDMQAPRSTRLVSSLSVGGTVRAVGGTLLNTPGAHVVSDDGNFVAFVSASRDLATDPTNLNTQVYVRNMTTGAVVLASERGGVAGNGPSTLPALSGDGRFVAFMSTATNLTDDAPVTTSSQIYVRDLAPGGVVTLESKTWDGLVINGGVSTMPALSSDGRYVAFESTIQLDNRSDRDAGTFDVYLRDRTLGQTTHVSRSPSGTFFPPLHSQSASISADGSFVAFHSLDMALVAGDSNGTLDIFLYKTATAELSLVSRNDDGVQANGPSREPSLSADGSLVVFASSAANLGAPSTNTLQLYRRDLAANQAPVLAPLGHDVVLSEGESLSLTWSFTDDDASTSWRATVDYGDGSGTQRLELNANKTFSLAHLYAPGSYELTVVVTDDAGAPGTLKIDVVVNNIAPTVSMASALNLAFTRTLDSAGSFTDPGLGSGETYSAVVSWGDGTSAQTLTLDDGAFALRHTYAGAGSYTVTVTVADSNGDSGTGTTAVNVGGYSYEWLDPVGTTFIVGRNLPVKFRVLGPQGAPVFDPTVRVDVVDASGTTLAGPYVFGDQPSRSVTWSGDSYHVNVDTKDLAPGMYCLRVRFSSPTLSGEFTLATNGTAGLLRSRLH